MYRRQRADDENGGGARALDAQRAFQRADPADSRIRIEADIGYVEVLSVLFEPGPGSRGQQAQLTTVAKVGPIHEKSYNGSLGLARTENMKDVHHLFAVLWWFSCQGEECQKERLIKSKAVRYF